MLAQFTDEITSDFIIVPCDFVPPPSLQLSTLLDRFRMDPSGLLMAALFYETAPAPSTALVPGDEPDPPPAVLFDDAGTLLKIDDDVDAEELDVRMEMLWTHPRSRLRTDLRDAHVYVCKSDVATLLSDDVHRFQSIRSDFIPWLVEIQHRARRRTKWAARLAPVQGLSVLEHSTAHSAPARNPQSGSHSPPAEDAEGQKPPQVRSDAVVTRCALLVHTLADGPARRVNTLTALLEANRAVLQNVTFSADASHIIENQTQIAPNVILGSSTRVGERATLKQSVIGAHCTIGKNVRITGSVVMDHCVIQDGAKIEGCILGPRTTVGEKTQLTQCFTQPGYEVDAGGQCCAVIARAHHADMLVQERSRARSWIIPTMHGTRTRMMRRPRPRKRTGARHKYT